MTTFVLRSSDNALVMIEAPEKPDQSDRGQFYCYAYSKKYPCDKDICQCHDYDSALKQAIADGVKVADEKAIERLIVKAYPELIGTAVRHDTPYTLDVEMRNGWQYRSALWHDDPNEGWSDCTIEERYPEEFEYRQLAYLVLKEEPKQDGGKVIERLKDGIKICEEFGASMNEIGWATEQGILISGNDAKYILSQLTPAEPPVGTSASEQPTTVYTMTRDDKGNVEYFINGKKAESKGLLSTLDVRAEHPKVTPAEPKEEQWISVTDKIPKLGRHVLLFESPESIEIGYFLKSGTPWFKGEGFMSLQDEQPSQIHATHWMPLPEPPTIHRK